MKKGNYNKISDVKGVIVGHQTIKNGDIQTGVTIIKPSVENPFLNKLQCASYVINGYGKTTGLIQVDELGLLESYIGLTNTLCVGRVQDAIVERIINECKEQGKDAKSINVVVGECNDCRINNITDRKISFEYVDKAFEDCKEDFELGAVGAGRGMVCYGLKGGIGSASRIAEYSKSSYTVGALVLANHGLLSQLIIDGKKIEKEKENNTELEKGSIVVVIATDAPLDSRQLKRVAKRAAAGIARTGSEFGNGSGDIVIAFSTQNKVKHCFNREEVEEISSFEFLNDSIIDKIFSATVEAVEESVISALYNSETVGEFKNIKEYLK